MKIHEQMKERVIDLCTPPLQLPCNRKWIMDDRMTERGKLGQQILVSPSWFPTKAMKYC